MSLEENSATKGQEEDNAEEEDPLPLQHPPNIENQGEIQANASSLEQSTIWSGGERSELQQEGDLTLETPNYASAQQKANDERPSKTQKRKSESKEGSSRESKERHDKL